MLHGDKSNVSKAWELTEQIASSQPQRQALRWTVATARLESVLAEHSSCNGILRGDMAGTESSLPDLQTLSYRLICYATNLCLSMSNGL